MKRIVLLVTAALVAMMILVPTAMAQETTSESLPSTGGQAQPLPSTGGPSVILPIAAALLLSSGVVTYAVLRCR